MNIAYFLTTKSEVAYVYDDFTLRQALEKMNFHRYAAIPVLTRENKYIGTISEGTFLWFMMDDFHEALNTVEGGKACMHKLEEIKIADVVSIDNNPPVRITAKMEELLAKATENNFIPVVDDREFFIGIVKRKEIIKHFTDKVNDI